MKKDVEVDFVDNKAVHTVAEWILKKGKRNEEFHRGSFFQRYVQSKKRYSERLFSHRTFIDLRRMAIEQKVMTFRNAYDFCKNHFHRKFECIKADLEKTKPDADGFYNIPLDAQTDWFIIAEW